MTKRKSANKEDRVAGGEQPHATRWTARLDAMLGQRRDGDVAIAACCSLESVRRRRKRLGVAARRPMVNWTAKMDAALVAEPLTPSAKVAQRLGVTDAAVRMRRWRLRTGQ